MSLQDYVESLKNMEALQSNDIANTILYAVESPNYVNINEIVVRPMAKNSFQIEVKK